MTDNALSSDQQSAIGHLNKHRAEYRRMRAMAYWCTAIALIGAVIVCVVPVPFLKLSPGPMYNTLGSVDGTELIRISGTRTYPTTGELNMTTVTERGGPYGGLTLPEMYFGWINPNDVVAPVDLFYAPDVSKDEALQAGEISFTSAQSSAIAAALGYLDIPVTSTVEVAQVTADGPAAGILSPGDVILTLQGTDISRPQQVQRIIRRMKAGSTAKFVVERAGDETEANVIVGRSPVNPKWGYVGIYGATQYRGPFPIEFGIDGVGGPSAGLMFSLGIIDKLTEDNLVGEGLVAGTGTITPTGEVGAIGGIAQKLYAARDAGIELFLAPTENCEQVIAAQARGLNIARVSTLAEAMDVLADWKAGSVDLPRCELP